MKKLTREFSNTNNGPRLFPKPLKITVLLLFFGFLQIIISGNSFGNKRSAFVQTIKISGNVTDAITGEFIIGASVVEKGTTNGAITDVNGNYSIYISSPKGILVLSYIGYETQEIAIERMFLKKMIVICLCRPYG